MPKVLLVAMHATSTQIAHIARTLHNFGIQTNYAYANSKTSSVQTPAGAFSAGSTELRNYLRTYDAVFISETAPWTVHYGVRAAVKWLNWNQPEDPPVVYFGYNLSTLVTEHDGELPNDFPILRIDPSDLNNTASIADNNAFLHFTAYYARHGTPIFLTREQTTLYTPTICAYETSGSNARIAYWRLNTDNHTTLIETSYTHRVAVDNRAGEILAIPANIPPDGNTYPNNTCIAYRYYNRFFLPLIARRTYLPSTYVEPSPAPMLDIFWLLYALKLCHIQPAWRIPLQFETDHPLELRTNSITLSETDKLRIKRDTFDWWRGFCRETGLVVINGVQVGGRDREQSNNRHWYLINHPDPDIRAIAQQVHEILVAGHREGTLVCGIHDHTINDTRGFGARREMANFRRHTNPNSRYGAPHNVPIQHGACCVAKHIAPSGTPVDTIETTIGDDTIYEWDFTGRTTDTGSLINTMPMQNIHAARIVIESGIDEMLAMGFPDGHCGEHRYTNTAANNSGGIAYWQAAKELGFRALRSGYCCNEHFDNSTPGARNQTIPPSSIWNGFHLLPHDTIDTTTGSAPSTWGLYDPNAGANDRHAVGAFGLDSTSNDITGQWTTNRNTAAWRAHRRALCHMTGTWLSLNILNLGAIYIHPAYSWYGCNPNTPVARFDGENILNANGQPHWNPTVELMENIRLVVKVLSDYLYFGSVSDLIKVREKVMG